MKFGKTGRLLAMLSVTAGFFLVELVVGYMCHSMALVADSFHMLSDVLALLVAFLSVRISKRTSTKNTFGWARAEVLGALVNSVFLMALCFSIFVESIDRFHNPHPVSDPILVLVVGCVGLAVNLFGLLIFHQHSHGGGDSHGHGGHGHSHGSHGHSHGSHGHSHGKKDKKGDKGKSGTPEEKLEESLLAKQRLSEDHIHPNEAQASGELAVVADIPQPRIASSSQLNMRGVFLHVLGDALGSVVVIISALVIKFTNWEYEDYIDPAMSILLVLIISYTTLPLLRESALILMQTVPTHIEIEDIRTRLQQIEGVLAVHELHIWQLAGDRIIASAHIRCHNLQEYMRVAGKIKQFFHDVGIHSTTMQPEFDEVSVNPNDDSLTNPINPMSTCIIACPTDAKGCAESVCCRKPAANGKVTVVVDRPISQSLDGQARALESVLTDGRVPPDSVFSPPPPSSYSVVLDLPKKGGD
ncbi:Zinc transporter 1 [Hypsibius exemplaris]|uniref:Zinc transporter 1 n=1 Tax=Hypsibius exemplaris TaxID=2072580 RepID=A0A1W0X024_HYPEX|nr:Zinc transporter 1 [Hypsibius exemplaris]